MTLSRRFVLRGAGASLALPLLPSLLTPREARAQVASRRCFVHLATPHGGVWAARMFPTLPSSGVQTLEYAGRTMRRFDLQLRQANGTASLSPVLSAPSSALTDRLVSKMLVLQGLDIPWYISHHTGGHLGNFARNDGNGGDGGRAQTLAQRRTIDQVMAWSPAFYGDLLGVRERVMMMGEGLSFNHADPANRVGDIQQVGASALTPHQLFDRLFPQTGPVTSRPLIVDRVYANYRRLRDSGSLSQADRTRLEQHMQRVYELQRRLTVSGSCSQATRPTDPYAQLNQSHVTYQAPYAVDPEAHGRFFRVLTDVMVLALSCGVSRLGVIRVEPDFSTVPIGDWHHQVAHESNGPDGIKQTVLAEAHQRFFQSVMVDLAAKMDSVDTGDGRTLLDHSLAVWTQESGNMTHDAYTLPVIAFGSAGGFLRTGQACDYRNLAAPLTPSAHERQYPGLLWHQWLGTVLQAMGVPRSEWENASVNPGYPDYRYANVNWVSINTAQAYPESVWTVAGEVLPWLRA